MMTREEFYKKYGETEVIFSSYYKFSFTYKAMLDDGSVLLCDYGGNSEEIYRFEVSRDAKMRVIDLQPYWGSVSKDGDEICSFYDY